MTREEAIKIFNTVLFLGKCDCQEGEIEECFKMAINALKQQPSEDAVSRQAVLDIDFKRIILTTAKPAEMIEQKVRALPSITPTQEPILDKIRAEIKEVYNDRPYSYNHSQRTELFCEVMEIIDKYKEREG